jgi:two-component sensor histidine kinase
MTDTPGEAPAPARKPRPIAVYLFVLALVALVPAFAFSAILLQRNNEAQEQVVQSLTIATTRAIVQSIDREISGMISTLRALASSPALNDNDLEAIYRRAEAVLAGSGNNLALINDDFEVLLNTRVPFGEPLRPVQNTQNLTLALSTGEVVIGDVVFSPTAETYIVPVLVPHRTDEGQAQVIVLTQEATLLQSVLLSQQMPDGWEVALVDKANNVIVSSDAENAAVGQAFFIPPQLTPNGTREWNYADGAGDQQFATISWTSPLTGWSIVAWAPRTLIDRPLSDAVWSLIYGGVLLAALVAATIYWVTNQIAGSVQGLAADARRLGSGEPIPVRDYPISEIATVSGAIGEASRQRLAAESEVRFLLRELAHRSKNQMTVIAAMAKQTAKGAESVPDFVQSFEKRIFGLARSTDLLLANGALGVDLQELLTRQIDPFCPVDGGRVTLLGPQLRLNTQAAQILGMAAHEMATNAVKYGAFAREDGSLAVTWTRHGDRLRFAWRERVTVMNRGVERRGFGTVVLENMVGQALGATVERAIHADGIEWRFDIPLEVLDPRIAPNGTEEPAPKQAAQ